MTVRTPWRLERGPAVGGQTLERVGADERAGADAAAVGGRQAAEVADVAAAVPVEVSSVIGHRLAASLRPRQEI